jgi:outer membrane protein OmpA-like peptidoglycan-associated protein
MPSLGVHADLEGSQKKWIFGAIGIAVVLHLMAAWALGWYKIPGLEIPSSHSAPTGPFTVKSIEINPDTYKPQQNNPIEKLPVADPTQNPAQFNLDPNLVEKALQTPQPALATPSIPDPGKTIAAADMSQGLPFAESDTAKVSAEIAKVDPTTTSGPITSAKFAQDLISASAGSPQAGTPGGATVTGDGKTGTLPGFASLVPGFKPGSPDLTKLPEPVLLRLPSDVLFDFDSATLKPEASSLLSQAIGMITKYPEADIRIDGYSDSFGKLDYNQSLSQQRAVAVQTWLQQHITQTGYKFSSLGHGSTNFVVSTQGSIEQQQPNRRVEILIQALKP